MFETWRVCAVLLALVLAGCMTQPQVEPAPPPAPAAPVAVKPAIDEKARAEEAKAMLAQAETDVQRARAKRALWLKAWGELIAARQAVAGNDSEGAIRHSRLASEFSQLGLEQLAYPAVK